MHVNKPASNMTQKQSSTFNLWFLSDHWRSAGSAARVPAVRVQEADNVVPVIICASEERVGATMATINSVHSNTDASVFFYIVTLRDAVKLTRFVACFRCKDYSFIRGVKMNRYESAVGFKVKDTTTPMCRPLDRSKCTGCTNFKIAMKKKSYEDATPLLPHSVFKLVKVQTSAKDSRKMRHWNVSQVLPTKATCPTTATRLAMHRQMYNQKSGGDLDAMRRTQSQTKSRPVVSSVERCLSTVLAR